MSIFTIVLGTLVALEFFYIMYLETVVPTSETTGRVFNMTQQELSNKNVQTLFKNQGIYNGLLGLALLYSMYISTAGKELTALLLAFIILVAIYGGVTSDKKIILKQGGLAILALLSLIFI